MAGEEDMSGVWVWAKSRHVEWIALMMAMTYVACFYGWHIGVPIQISVSGVQLWLRAVNVLPIVLGIVSTAMLASPMPWIDGIASENVRFVGLAAYVVLGALIIGSVLLPVRLLSIVPRKYVPGIDSMDATGSASFSEVISDYRFSVYVIPAMFFLSCAIAAISLLGKILGSLIDVMLYVFNVVLSLIPSIAPCSPLSLTGVSEDGLVMLWMLIVAVLYVLALICYWRWSSRNLIGDFFAMKS